MKPTYSLLLIFSFASAYSDAAENEKYYQAATT